MSLFSFSLSLGFRNFRLSSGALIAVVLCGAAHFAVGQTAHFTRAQVTIGAGSFSGPVDLAFDASGDLIVADYDARAITEIVAVNGTIPASATVRRLVSGSPLLPVGVALDGNGNIFFSDIFSGTVQEIEAVNGRIPDSPTVRIVANGFSDPEGLAVDQYGDVFVADSGHNAVKEILAVSGTIPNSPTVITLGNGFYNPEGVAFDRNGNLFVGDFYNYAIKEILAVNGTIPSSPAINTVVSGVLAKRLKVDRQGDIYFADNGGVKEVLAINGTIPPSPTIAVLVPQIGGSTGVWDAAGVAVDTAGNIYAADIGGSRVIRESFLTADFGPLRVGATSPLMTLVFTFDSAGTLGSISALTQGVAGLDFSNAGTGYCTTSSAYYSPGDTCSLDVTFTSTSAGSRYGAGVLRNGQGIPVGQAFVQGTGVAPQVNFTPGMESAALSSGLTAPTAVAVDAGGTLYVADNNSLVKAAPTSGGYTVSTISSNLSVPWGVAVDGAGNVYVGDNANSRVLKEIPTASGYLETTFASGFIPMGIAVDGSGNVYIVDQFGGRIVKETPTNGVYTASTVLSGLSNPFGVAVDGAGNLYIADTNQKGILKETLTSGSFVQSLIPAAGQVSPQSVAVDAVGNVYWEDSLSDNIFKETPNSGGYIESTIVNDLHTPPGPAGVAVDSTGNVFIAYLANKSIVKADFADGPALQFVSTTAGATSPDSPKTLTLTNSGNAPLSFPVPSSGNNPNISANFTLDSSNPADCPLITSSSPSPGALAATASCQLPISFTPTASGAITGYLIVTDNNPNNNTQRVALSGAAQAIPAITWPTPAAITYGTPLSATQLDASSTVAGTLSYSPPAGTLLGAGTQTLTATFTPDDTTDYAAATQSVALTVNQASPTVTWPTPAAIPYGTQLSATQLNATANVPGTFAYSPAAGTVLTAGTQTLTVTFTPTDSTNYAAVTQSITMTVKKATPVITWPTPAPTTYGTALSATQLDATASLPGSFAYSPAAGTVLSAGTQTLTVTFTPTDTTDNAAVTQSVLLTVNKATPVITWPKPAPITYGTGLSAAQLNATANVPGSFAYNPSADTIPAVGSDTLTTTFTPTDISDYTTATASILLTVNPAPGFSLSAAPSSLPLTQNSSATTTITVNSTGGFTGYVQLAVAGLPTGVTASFSTNPASKSSVLTLKAGPKATTGPVTLTITGTSGNIASSTKPALTVVARK